MLQVHHKTAPLLLKLVTCVDTAWQVQAIFKIASSQDLPSIPETLSPEASEFVLLCLQVRAACCAVPCPGLLCPWAQVIV